MKTQTNYHDPSYKARLEAVAELGERFPGPISALGFKHRKLGMWAGIYMQTKWQRDSGRDKLSIWYLVNQSLTLAPLAFYREYQTNPSEAYAKSKYAKRNPTRDLDFAPVTQLDVCRAWKEVFKLYDQTIEDKKSTYLLRRTLGYLRLSFSMQRKFWYAHATSMHHALWHYSPLLENTVIPQEEMSFWRGWIRFVLLNAKIAPPTTDFFLSPLLKLTMPTNSPLGSSAYSFKKEPLLRSLFLRFIVSTKATVSSRH